MITCPYCGNMFGITSNSNGTNYCSVCKRYFKNPIYFATSNTPLTKSNTSTTAAIEDSITIRLPDAANAARGFYYADDSVNLWQSEENKLTIKAKSITINDDKVSITIDKDNIDKFDVIEINGVRFVREDN